MGNDNSQEIGKETFSLTGELSDREKFFKEELERKEAALKEEIEKNKARQDKANAGVTRKLRDHDDQLERKNQEIADLKAKVAAFEAQQQQQAQQVQAPPQQQQQQQPRDVR